MLGPAFDEDVGEDAEAVADMCQKRGEGGGREEGGELKRKETGKRVLPLLRRGCAAAQEEVGAGPGRARARG